MKPKHNLILGEPRTAAAWFRTEADKAFARDIIENAYKYDTDVHGALFAPIEWSEIGPEDPAYPEPPQRDLRLLIGRSKVVGFRTEKAREIAAFIDDLSFRDLTRLRATTRQQYARLNPGKPELTDEQCDSYIQMVGPEVHEREIRAAVDQGRVS